MRQRPARAEPHERATEPGSVPFMFLAPNGRVFIPGRPRYPLSVMYADGKILVLGGGDPPTNTAEVIDLN